MRAKLFLPLLLLPASLSAQTVKEWVTHPTVSSSVILFDRYTAQTNSSHVSALALLGATFGADTPFRVNLYYDIVEKRLMTYEATWQPIPQIGIHAGLQRMPFVTEMTFSRNSLGMIGYSQSVYHFAGFHYDMAGISSRSRDFGIVLEGALGPREGYALLKYAVGVFNGNGYEIWDNNRAKDLQGRLILQPTRYLMFSLGGMYGHYSVFDEAGREQLAARHRVSSGVWYDRDDWFLRGENIFAVTGPFRSNGTMLLAGWHFLPRLQLTARLDRLQKDLSDANSTTTNVEICFSHSLTEDGAINYRIQYGHSFYSDPALPGKDVLSLCLSLALRRKL